MKNSNSHAGFLSGYGYLFALIASVVLFYGCENAVSRSSAVSAPSLPVLGVETRPATTYQEFSAALQGARDVEIRPQVSGALEKIYVDEGAHVQKGQPLFKINDALYRQNLLNAEAGLEAANANLENAQINLAKLAPLVQNHVVSDVQLKAAQAAKDAAEAGVAQAKAGVSLARINLGYTLIQAPVDGYIGRIPFKTGSLVETNTAAPLTTLSAADQIFAYFSMSETDFLAFKHAYGGRTMADKISGLPAVELVMADDSLYPEQGKVQTVLGEFDKTMGTISFRAVFPNENGLLRSGNTGKIRIPRTQNQDVIIPQESTFELQNKVFVYALGSGNRVMGTPITIAGRSGNYYLVTQGIKPGDKIVYTGLDRLHDGAVIQPEKVSLDSLLITDPL